MGMKFCPQCNTNVRVVLRNGKMCCECCGFDADHMMPPVAGISRSNVSTHSQTVSKPDVHDSEDNTFSQYTQRPADPFSTTRFTTVALILCSVLVALLAIFVTQAEWALNEDMTECYYSTVYEKALEENVGYVVYLSVAAIIIVMFLIPQFLGAVYFAIGIWTMFLNEIGIGGDAILAGMFALAISLVAGYYVYKFKKEIGSSSILSTSLWLVKFH